MVVKVPIFPLPNSILYPGVYLPLHVFEERYKNMLKKVMESDGELAVSYAPEVQPDKFFPNMICGSGPVRILKKYESGESDILVFGTQRIRFNKYVQELPYLIGEGEVLHINREMPQKTHDDLLVQIRDMVIGWIFANIEDSQRPIQFFKNMADLEPLCNFVAFHFIPEFDKKQKMLEEDSLEAKAQVIWKVLKDFEASGEKNPIGAPLIFPGTQTDEGFN